MYKKARRVIKIRKTDDFEILPVFNILRMKKIAATIAAVGCTSLFIGKIDIKGNKQHKKNKFANRKSEDIFFSNFMLLIFYKF